ncbi:hypothetical protein [Sphingobacterium hotanense]|uniref:Uncharacterized protein n=1 Tax=Sphingobacterium hotanense TaxID=649196 RepID=A0ABT7NQS2_9SPHI|nr:hypothetical protein [Sphingobacterium hotanense]MDM1049505.1 hypothetical protein [Sphingobacterium hotanense]
MSDYQGEKFRSFVSKMKENYKDYGFDKKPTNEILAEMIGVSSVQLNRYYKSKSLERETVSNITKTFKVEENEIWGDDVGKSKDTTAIILGNAAPNMYIVPFKSYAGFLRGYGDGLGMDGNIEKIYYPLIKGEAFAFQIGGQSAFPLFPENSWFVGKPIDSPDDLLKGRLYTWQTIDGIVTKIYDGMDDEFFYVSSVNDDFNPVKPFHRKNVKVIYRQVGKLDNFEY